MNKSKSSIKPVKERSQILSTLRENLTLEVQQFEKEISDLKKFRGLSPGTLQEKISSIQEKIDRLKELSDLAKTFMSNGNTTHLFIYQHSYGKTITPGDEYFLGTDNIMWKGASSISFMPEFKDKAAGVSWSTYNDRGEGNEYFHSYFRI